MRSRSLSIPAVLFLAAACGSGSKIVEPPPPPPPAGLSVALTPDADDLVAAQALGWTNGIPNADVTLMPKDSSAAPRTLKSSSTGAVDFGPVTPGVYIVESTRWLTTTEVAKLPGSQDVDGWVSKTQLTLTAQGSQQHIAVPASRRKGLVISEWAFNVEIFVETSSTYFFGGYLEIFNNADTTAYLDGLMVVEGFAWDFDYPNFPCVPFGSQLGLDPTGIWTRRVQQFPGRGRDYPLPAGRSVVVAIDAIDHHAIGAQGIDLSHADFEFWGGPGDVDNPAVPNMIDTLSTGRNIQGHGPLFLGSAITAVLARPYDKATAPRFVGSDGNEFAKVSRDLILDLISLYPNFVYIYPRCVRVVNSVFDQESSDVRGYDENVEWDFSVSRRAIPVPLSSHVILQDSRNSDADLVRTHRSPGVVP
jgi:hypothetical protein